MKNKIAIAGAGISGAYLYRVMINAGVDPKDIDIFDVEHKTVCGISPCGWGVTLGFEGLIQDVGLDPARYALRQFDRVVLDEMEIGMHLLSINKPKLIKDLLGEAEIKQGLARLQPSSRSVPYVEDYDRVVDATGVARAYLPVIQHDLIWPCVQYRIRPPYPLGLRTKISRLGYAWSFPLSDTIYHVGAGSFATNPHRMLQDLGWMDRSEIICSCAGGIRLTAPVASQPFVSGNVWGIGEAIGCVAPFGGEGIIPGMRSARILWDSWRYPDFYTDNILKEFKWMEDERRVLDNLIQGKVGIGSAFTIRRTAKRSNFKIGFWQALKMLRRMKNE